MTPEDLEQYDAQQVLLARSVLSEAAIPEDWAEAHGVSLVTRPKHVPESISRTWVQGSGLLFNWPLDDGGHVPQFRPFDPVTDDRGEEHKYIFPPRGEHNPGSFTSPLREPSDGSPVLVVEGTKQCRAAAVWAPDGWGVRGISGCHNWTGTDLSWCEDREVLILFDKDMSDNRDVHDAATGLRDALTAEGASSVRFVRLTNARAKDGLDDVLGRMPEERRTKYLERLSRTGTAKLGRPPAHKSANPLFDKRGGLLAQSTAEAVLDGQPAALAKDLMISLYRDGVFRLDRGKEPLFESVQKLLGEEYRPNWRSTVEESLVGILSGRGLRLPEHYTEPVLNLRNGMLDLRTGQLLPHSPAYLSRVQVDVAWDPDAVCPRYEKWVSESCPGQVDDLEESVSAMLDPSATPSKAVFLFGPSRSGKSTFLRIMQAVAGVSNCSGVSLHMLSDDRFAAANLYGRMLNTCADLSASHLSDTSLFKQMTGGDLITANRKYGHEFQFTNTALFAFSANRIPTVSEASSAYAERIKPFSFPHSFAGREDPRVEADVLAELPGILVRWVGAWQRRTERGGYLPTQVEVQREFEAASDRVRLWADKVAVIHTDAAGSLVGEGQGTGKTELYISFKQWLEREGGAGAMKRGDFLHRLESLPGVAEVRLRHRSKNIGLNITVCPDDEKDKSRMLIGEGTNQD